MTASLHHTHLLSSDIENTIRFYKEYFGGVVVLDMELAGSRNIFMRIGKGNLHFYSQAPKNKTRGTIHHLGIQVNDLSGLLMKMKNDSIKITNEIKDYGFWKYIMILAPDDVLLELFEVDHDKMPDEYKEYFDFAV
jgi:catechol 2,3-dioxygenase-like lactoylglutathione lyase family enzyme